MTNYKTTDVYGYISQLEIYLKGDLDQFHKICKEVEKKEQDDLLSSSSTPITSSLSGSTLTTETTRNPDNPYSYFPRYFRTTIPHTLTLFSTIDFIGYLSGVNENVGSTFKNFTEFFKQSSITVNNDEIELLSQVYRNGLGHIYFPKLNLGISYHSSNPVGKLFFRDSLNTIVLNVNHLEKLVIDTFEKIKNTSSLYPEMERKHQSIIKEYQSKHGGLLSRVVV